MVEQYTNVQQLPLGMLEEVIKTLDVDDILTLNSANKYFNSITPTVLYKDIIFNHKFLEPDISAQGIVNGTYFDTNTVLGIITNTEGDDEARIQLEVDRSLREKERFFFQFKEKQWNQILPSIKKFNMYIKSSRSINPEKFINELESYSNLERYKLYLDTQAGIDLLVNYTGDKFESMKRLELNVRYALSFEIKAVFPHFAQLKELVLELNLWRGNVEWLADFQSGNLIYFKFKDIGFTAEFLDIVYRNFKNLKRLEFELYSLTLDQDIGNCPIFENIVDLKFTILTECHPRVLHYLTDVRYWPNLKSLDAYYYRKREHIVFEGRRNNLISLYTAIIDPHNLIQWDNLDQLKVLKLDLGSEFNLDMLNTILKRLSNLKELFLAGSLACELFEFQPEIQLYKLTIRELSNFTPTFVTFIKKLTSLRNLILYFAENTFKDNVALDQVLGDNHTFSSLRSICLNDAPIKLENWFVNNSEFLSKVVRHKNYKIHDNIYYQ